MKSIILAAVTVFVSISTFAKSVEPAKLITCVVMEDDDTTGGSQPVARISIALDSLGIASQVRLQKVGTRASAFAPNALNLKFDDIHSLISHGVRPNKVVDHEDGKLVFDWNIARVEYVTAANEAGISVDIAINDHTYSGVPGSTITYKLDGKTVGSADVGATTICSGAVKIKR